jgi:hypothetical protein
MRDVLVRSGGHSQVAVFALELEHSKINEFTKRLFENMPKKINRCLQLVQ